MRVVGQNYLRRSFDAQATCVLIFDEHGNPVVVIRESPGQITTYVAGDTGFEELCRQLGAQAPPRVQTLAAPRPEILLR